MRGTTVDNVESFPWDHTGCSPELLLDFIRRHERVTGHKPRLDACVEEFGGRYWVVIVCLWKLRDRGLI